MEEGEGKGGVAPQDVSSDGGGAATTLSQQRNSAARRLARSGSGTFLSRCQPQPLSHSPC